MKITEKDTQNFPKVINAGAQQLTEEELATLVTHPEFKIEPNLPDYCDEPYFTSDGKYVICANYSATYKQIPLTMFYIFDRQGWDNTAPYKDLDWHTALADIKIDGLACVARKIDINYAEEITGLNAGGFIYER